MRLIYILSATFMVLIIFLIVGTFIYLEKGRHQTFIFIINLGGRDIGDVKIDRHKTEDKIILTSSQRRPFEPGLTEFQKRLIIDRKSGLTEKYTEKDTGAGSSKQVLIENKNLILNFLAIYNSEFWCLSRSLQRGNFFIYNPPDIMLYIPMIASYNFRRGGAQSFNVICQADTQLPPYKKILVLRSIRDEYIEVLGRKTKTEVLVVKSKLEPDAYLWVAKSDHSIARYEIPEIGLRFRRADSLIEPEIEKYELSDLSYKTQTVSFKSGDLTLSGTLTEPSTITKDSGHPAILLINERGFFDRDCGGIFCDIADFLSKKGFLVMRFDKRGIGKSEGNESGISVSDDLRDAGAALNYLAGLKSVDKTKIAVLGHGKGAYLAGRLALEDKNVSSCILMAYNPTALSADFETESVRERIKELGEIDAGYPESVKKLRDHTKKMIEEAKKDWTNVFGSKVFVGRMRERADLKTEDFLVKIKVPVLVLQGKKDKHVWFEYLKSMPQKIVYFRNLGHYFGTLSTIGDTNVRIHYKIDKEVTEAIHDWLGNNLLKKAPEAKPVEAGSENLPQIHLEEFDKQQNL